jgi:hypothetical protein
VQKHKLKIPSGVINQKLVAWTRTRSVCTAVSCVHFTCKSSYGFLGFFQNSKNSETVIFRRGNLFCGFARFNLIFNSWRKLHRIGYYRRRVGESQCSSWFMSFGMMTWLDDFRPLLWKAQILENSRNLARIQTASRNLLCAYLWLWTIVRLRQTLRQTFSIGDNSGTNTGYLNINEAKLIACNCEFLRIIVWVWGLTFMDNKINSKLK